MFDATVLPDLPKSPHDIAFVRAMLRHVCVVDLSIPTLRWLLGMGIG